jgi:hypothetical protein
MRKIYCTTLICLVSLSALFSHADAQWVQSNAPQHSYVRSFANVGDACFCAITSIGDSAGGVFISTDSGVNWSATALQNISVYTLAVSDTYLFAGTNAGVYRTSDKGASWTAVNTGLNYPLVWVLSVMDTNIFAGTSGGGLFRSTDRGLHWSQTGIRGGNILSLAISGTTLYVGATGFIFRSNNYGEEVTTIGMTMAQIPSLAFRGGTVFAGTDREGVYAMVNDSVWLPAGLSDKPVWSLLFSDTTLFAGSESGVFMYTNDDTSWQMENAGLTDSAIWSLGVAGSAMLAGTYGDGIWRRPLTEMVTSVINPPAVSPGTYALNQNYPNPFNPTTTIRYNVGGVAAANIRLSVYDVLGREVAVLVNDKKASGSYDATFDGSGLASGVYFYRLQAGSFIDTRKLILLR